MTINWQKVYKLSKDEFSENPDKYAEPELIHSLGKVRKLTQEKMRPSPVSGSLARSTGSVISQHHISKTDPIKKSKASDIFCEGVPFSTYSIILSSKLFNGIGIYLDTKGPDGMSWVMFHVDIRSKGFNSRLPLIWIVEKVYDDKKNKKIDKYTYPQIDSSCWKLLNDERLYKRKQFGISRSQKIS